LVRESSVDQCHLTISHFFAYPTVSLLLPIQSQISPRFPTPPPGNAHKMLRFHGFKKVLNISPDCQECAIKQPESDTPNMSWFPFTTQFGLFKKRSCPGRPLGPSP